MPDLIQLPAGRVAADPALVQQLIAVQFPNWAHLPVRDVARNGSDNRSFRLGDTMLVRMPTAAHYAGQVAVEQYWLPRLAPHLPLQIPEPLAQGQPTADFPWPWSVYRWLPGEPADADPAIDMIRLACDLAAFLLKLQAQAATDGPPPGVRNFQRGGVLAHYDKETRAAVQSLGHIIDGRAALQVWQSALRARWCGPPVWLHGDVTLDNLLVRDGKLAAVIDFGCCAVGDPACDLAIAWRNFDAAARQTYLARLALDQATVWRGAGWALWKALIVLAARPGTNPAGREQASAVIATIIAEFAR